MSKGCGCSRSKQGGGAIIDARDLADLAVPFGIFLAQRGLAKYFKSREASANKPKTPTASKKQSTPKKTTPKKGGSADQHNKASCALCQRRGGSAPPASSETRAIVHQELQRLSHELRLLLENAAL